jgi:sec-independent protein translocase protein TatA
MGFRGMNFGSLLIIFFIVVLLFGTKRLREIGSDLGAAIKSFRKGMQEEDSK